MGEISDDMIEGRCCSLCGQYFVTEDGEDLFEHGHPVACKECWDKDCGYEKATAETL